LPGIFVATLEVVPIPDRDVAAVETVGARDAVDMVVVVSVAIEVILAFDWDGRGGRAVGRRDSKGEETLLGETIGTFTGGRDVVNIGAGGAERVGGREVGDVVKGLEGCGAEVLDRDAGGGDVAKRSCDALAICRGEVLGDIEMRDWEDG
jgi:hypothetical protein